MGAAPKRMNLKLSFMGNSLMNHLHKRSKLFILIYTYLIA